MTIAEKFMLSDPKAYFISKSLDHKIDEYIRKRQAKKQDPNKKVGLEEALRNSDELLEIINGFENPPREIMAEVTPEGKEAVMNYYQSFKNNLIKKYCNHLILGYNAIRIGKELLTIIVNLERKNARLINFTAT